MPKLRILAAVMLALWLAVGPAGSAWASGGGFACESMAGEVPADDCCGDELPAATTCAGVCAAAFPGIAAAHPEMARERDGIRPTAPASPRYASRAGPPDITPPRALLS